MFDYFPWDPNGLTAYSKRQILLKEQPLKISCFFHGTSLQIMQIKMEKNGSEKIVW